MKIITPFLLALLSVSGETDGEPFYIGTWTIDLVALQDNPGMKRIIQKIENFAKEGVAFGKLTNEEARQFIESELASFGIHASRQIYSFTLNGSEVVMKVYTKIEGEEVEEEIIYEVDGSDPTSLFPVSANAPLLKVKALDSGGISVLEESDTNPLILKRVVEQDGYTIRD